MTTPSVQATPPLLRRSLIVASGTLLSRLTGLIRVAVTVAVLGATVLGDTYNRSNSTPNIIYELLLGGVLTASLLPIFVAAHEDDDRSATAAIFTVALAILGVFTVVGMIFAPAIASFFAGNVQDELARRDAVQLGTSLVRLFIPQMLFYGFTALATAALNARRRYGAAAYAPVLNNIVVIAMLLLVRDELQACTSDNCGVRYAVEHTAFTRWLGIGTTLGIFAMASALAVALLRIKVPLLTGWSGVRHPAVSRMIRLSGWTIGYVIANQIALLYIMRLTGTDTGALSQYQVAFMFFQLPHGLLAVSIMTAVGSEVASAATRGDTDMFSARFVAGFRLLLLAMIPATGVTIAFAPALTNLVRHGKFNQLEAQQTAQVLIAMACGLVAFSVYLYTLRAFYALGNTRTPFFINCGENIINILLAIALFHRFGVAGLGFAFAAAYAVAAAAAVVALQRTTGNLGLKQLLGVSAKAIAATIVAALVGWLIARGHYANVARTVFAGLGSIAVFLTMSRVLGLQEFSGFASAIRARRHTRV